MKHPDAFLQAITASPEDDTPRLVYADWCEENGEPDRADLIRAQCELARLTTDSPRRRLLAARAWELVNRHGEEWAAPVRDLVEEWHFRRGFIDRVTVSAETLITRADELFRL